jgi:ribonuclease R
MELSIQSLLANFADEKLVAPKALEKKMGCEEASSIHQLQIALDALEKIGLLVKERGKYRRVVESEWVEGKLRCSSKGFGFAIQDQEGSEDIYIRESQLSNAWNGDRVLVKVTKEGRRRRSPEGEVRLILERSNPSVIARIKQTEQGVRGIPLDDRLLFELELQSSDLVPDPTAAIDQLAHVQVRRYPLGQYPPIGVITQILGNDAESSADTELVCCKYGFPREFSEAALNQLPVFAKKLKKADFKNRLDLRQRFTLVLGESADLSLSLEPIPDGGWTLGIHIADISPMIEVDSALDQEINKRGLGIYLGKTAIPLLPETVASASFVAEQEQLAISLLLRLDPEAAVLEYEIQPSVVMVDQVLNPAQLEASLEQSSGILSECLSSLRSLSQLLRQQRHRRGSFDFNLGENSLTRYTDEGLSAAVALDPSHSVRMLLTEFALLANQTILSHLQALGVPAIYRVQSPPDAFEVQELIKLAANLGIPLSLAAEDMVQPQDYQGFVALIAESELAAVLTELLLGTLQTPTYSGVAGPHFALAAVGYGSIVSPLSRYADLLNQRVLHLVFEQGRDRRTTRTKDRVNLRHSSCLGQVSWNVLPPESQRELETAIAAAILHLNERGRTAQQAIKDLVGLQKVKQMQERTGEVFPGLITGIQSYGFFVEIIDLLVEGLVHVSSLKDDWYEYRSRQQTLIGRKNRRQYRLGDLVEVQVKSVDYYRQQIDLLVVGGGSQASEEDWNEPGSEPDNEPDSEAESEEPTPKES